jgi:hypothetical protein
MLSALSARASKAQSCTSSLCQRVPVAIAINAQDHGLAVDHEMPLAVLQRSLSDPGEAPRPVIAAARDRGTTPGRLEPECLGWGCRTQMPLTCDQDRHWQRFLGQRCAERLVPRLFQPFCALLYFRKFAAVPSRRCWRLVSGAAGDQDNSRPPGGARPCATGRKGLPMLRRG